MCWWICGPESDNDADNVHDDDDDDDWHDNDCCIPFSDDGPTCLLIPQLTISSVPPSRREPEQRGATDGQKFSSSNTENIFIRADHWTNAVYIFSLTLHLCGLKI